MPPLTTSAVRTLSLPGRHDADCREKPATIVPSRPFVLAPQRDADVQGAVPVDHLLLATPAPPARPRRPPRAAGGARTCCRPGLEHHDVQQIRLILDVAQLRLAALAVLELHRRAPPAWPGWSTPPPPGWRARGWPPPPACWESRRRRTRRSRRSAWRSPASGGHAIPASSTWRTPVLGGGLAARRRCARRTQPGDVQQQHHLAAFLQKSDHRAHAARWSAAGAPAAARSAVTGRMRTGPSTRMAALDDAVRSAQRALVDGTRALATRPSSAASDGAAASALLAVNSVTSSAASPSGIPAGRAAQDGDGGRRAHWRHSSGRRLGDQRGHVDHADQLPLPLELAAQEARAVGGAAGVGRRGRRAAR